MVGLEGIRMDIPNPDTPLARWRSCLRESLSYTILVTSPDLMINEVRKDWTDMQCIEVIGRAQEGHSLVEGKIPACVYAVAINYFTNRALDDCQTASQSIESSLHAATNLASLKDPSFKDDEEVESWGLRPKLPDPEIIRKRKVILLTDSGSLVYRKNGNKVKPETFLGNENVTSTPLEQYYCAGKGCWGGMARLGTVPGEIHLGSRLHNGTLP